MGVRRQCLGGGVSGKGGGDQWERGSQDGVPGAEDLREELEVVFRWGDLGRGLLRGEG